MIEEYHKPTSLQQMMALKPMRAIPLFVFTPTVFKFRRRPCPTTVQRTRSYCVQMESKLSSRSTKVNDRLKVDTITVGDVKICGISIAATETCIWIPSLSLAFDAGKCPLQVIPMRFMAITHGHCDHVHGLPLHRATRALQKMEDPVYLVPPPIHADIDNLVHAVARLDQSTMRAQTVALAPDVDWFDLKRDWRVKSFRTFHTVPSQGYIVYQRRRKLKAEHVGKSIDALKQLKQSGVDINRTDWIPQIAFTGDSTLDAIDQCEDVRRARIVITEMTFLDDVVSLEHARDFGHVHLDEVVQRAHLFDRNHHVVFTHFSARYSAQEIRDALQKLPGDLLLKCHALGAGPLHVSAVAEKDDR